ncbi:MAG: hypothetical protein WBD20_23195 [Pirellulaceae bacterium]
MNQTNLFSDHTLEPPGTIVVIGAGPLGIEAALYGRFLGYNVTLIEAEAIGHSLRSQRDQPVPMMPDRCLSPLALSALNAQNPEAPPLVLPTLIGEWIDRVMVGLTETDLLRGRVRCPEAVTRIGQLEIERDEEDSDEEELPPPDFRITVGEDEFVDAEAVIVAIGDAIKIPTDFETPCPYFFTLGQGSSGDPERDFLLGLKGIVDIYANLAGRETLDLYRPVRGNPVVAEVDDEDDEDLFDDELE